jgi:hypothetical protein
MTDKKVPMNEINCEVIERDLWAQVEIRIGEGKGSRWIRFSPKQARRLAVKLLTLAEEAEGVRAAKEDK